MPGYKSWMEQSYTVKGPWKAITNPAYAADSKYEETIYIQQLSERVWGDIFYKEMGVDGNDQAPTVEKRFKFEGTIADSVLSASYWNPDRRQKGRGTFCLYSYDSDVLRGKFSWYEPATNEVEAGEYVWQRLDA